MFTFGHDQNPKAIALGPMAEVDSFDSKSGISRVEQQDD